MNLLLLALMLFPSVSAHAVNLQCKVTGVHDFSVLEESLSTEEYPEVSANADEVWLGSSHYSVSAGDSITRRPGKGFDVQVQVDTMNGDSFLIAYANLPSRRENGSLLYRPPGRTKFSEIATISCK